MNKDVKKFLRKLPRKRGKALIRDALLVRDRHADMVAHLATHDASAAADLAVRTFGRLGALVVYEPGEVPDEELVSVLDAIVRDMDSTWGSVHAKVKEGADPTLPVH